MTLSRVDLKRSGFSLSMKTLIMNCSHKPKEPRKEGDVDSDGEEGGMVLENETPEEEEYVYSEESDADETDITGPVGST